jgi:NAD(P)-dependent dehydrogenase (short-subunit alcohol dehydrogenase family)
MIADHMTATVIVGGSSGLGRAIAQRGAARGEEVVITGRDRARAEAIAAEIGGATRGLAVDLSRPETIEAALADIAEVDHLVITAIEQGANTLRNFDIAAAVRVVTVKLVGYAETVRVLRPRFRPGASVVWPRSVRTRAPRWSRPSTEACRAWSRPSPWSSRPIG